MTTKITSITLQRDGLDQPWGFRLLGGTDHDKPLQIQRVFIGTPSEGNLHRGDTLIQINNQDATRMTHQEAHDAIKNAGNSMNISVQRGGAPPMTSQRPVQTVPPRPITPTPECIKQTPIISNMAAHIEGYGQPYQRGPSPQPPQKTMHEVLRHPVESLPTTHFADGKQMYLVEGTPMTLAEAEAHFEKARERVAITQQAYRTTPLITPSIKTKRDLPMGSYLRFDPTTKTEQYYQPPAPQHQIVSDSTMKQKVADTVASVAAGQGIPANMSSGQSVPSSNVIEIKVDDNKNLVHNLYNSPINLYSQENIQQTINSQTGMTPNVRYIPITKTNTYVGKAPTSKQVGFRASPSENKQQPLPSPKYDPKKSATYQAIQEEEWGDLKKLQEVEKNLESLKEYQALQNRVYNPAHTGESFHKETADHIAQSYSFKRVMAEVLGETEF